MAANKGKHARPANRAQTGRAANGHFTARHDIGKETRFKPGQSGNPSGRPKKTALDHALEAVLNLPSKEGDALIAHELAKALITHAQKGNAKMAQLIAERTGGKPLQPVQFDGRLETETLDPQQVTLRINELLAKARGRYR